MVSTGGVGVCLAGSDTHRPAAVVDAPGRSPWSIGRSVRVRVGRRIRTFGERGRSALRCESAGPTHIGSCWARRGATTRRMWWQQSGRAAGGLQAQGAAGDRAQPGCRSRQRHLRQGRRWKRDAAVFVQGSRWKATGGGDGQRRPRSPALRQALADCQRGGPDLRRTTAGVQATTGTVGARASRLLVPGQRPADGDERRSALDGDCELAGEWTRSGGAAGQSRGRALHGAPAWPSQHQPLPLSAQSDLEAGVAGPSQNTETELTAALLSHE